MRGLIIASAVSCMVALNGFAASDDGKTKEEQRTVPDFHAIEIGHAFKAEVTLGPKTSVKVIADENLLPHITTEVKGGALVVSIAKRDWTFHSPKRARLVIVTPQLDRISASGGSSIEAQASRGPSFESHSSGGSSVKVSGIDSDNVAVHASGGTQVTLEGKAKALKVSMSGGTKVDAEKLKTDAADVISSGGARARLNAGSELTAMLSGGTTLHVVGTPSKRDIRTSGGAKVYYE